MAYNLNKFNSMKELYERILPALKTKENELKREKLITINAKEIWNYCISNKWMMRKDLQIHEIVDDILNLNYKK